MKNEGVYLNLFDNEEDVFSSFSVGPADREGVDIILAWYKDEDYSGDAFVLFERDGRLYEVHGGHCSCYGLEGQWEPEETSLVALARALTVSKLGTGYRDDNEFAAELRMALYKRYGQQV